MELGLFEEVAEVVRSLLADDDRPLRLRARRWGIKVWFGPATPPRLHYEAQVIGADGVDDAEVLALEVGFHLEDPKVARNDAVLRAIQAQEKQWRKPLGRTPVAGPFLGRAKDWRRVSEVWPDPDLSAPDLAFEIGDRLVEYVSAIEPIVQADAG